MFTKLSDLTKACIYYGLAFGLMLTTSLLYPVLGEGVIAVAMLTPAISVLLMLLVVTPDGRSKAGWASLGLHRLGLRGWAAAVLVPLLVVGSSYSLVWVSGLADFTVPPDFKDVSLLLVPLFIIFAITKHALTGTLGEELGWRGYLLPRLTAALGARWALPLSGLLWGIWHLPVIFLTPLYHAEGNRLIIVPLFLTVATIMGVIPAYLRLSTNSLWPAVIFHAAQNVFWYMFRTATITSSPLVTEYLAGESGILLLFGYTLVVVAIIRISRHRLDYPKAQQEIRVEAVVGG
jgi:membrane protease YdiL (CAAX protease family)